MHAVPQSFHTVTPWYAQRWPWLLMLGPALVIVAGSYTSYLAVTHEDALVVGDYYKKGKAINQDLRRDRMASALRLSLGARYRGGRLEGRLESFGRPILAPFRIRLAHPTQPRKDRVLDARPDEQGNLDVALPALEMTHWQVVVEDEGRQWRLARSWSPAKDEALEIVADTPL